MHSLVQGYDLEGKMVVHRPKARTFEELTMFHADDYISFIRAATPNHSAEYMQQLKRFNMGAPGESDCPVFDGMYEYFAVSTAINRGRRGRAALATGRWGWGGAGRLERAYWTGGEVSKLCWVGVSKLPRQLRAAEQRRRTAAAV